MARRANEFLSVGTPLTYQNASLAATTTWPLYTAWTATRVRRAFYVNPTGLALNASNYFTIELKRGATVVANGISTATAALVASAWTSMTIVPASAVLAAGQSLDVVFTRTGTATLPIGQLLIELAHV